MSENGNGRGAPAEERPGLVYLRVSADGQVRRAVAYVRVSANVDVERVAALIEQQNALQLFADAAGYRVVRWYVDAPGIELEGSALDRLLNDVAVAGREFSVVLVWNYSRLAQNASRLSEVLRSLEGQGVEVLSVSDHAQLREWERQLSALTGDEGDDLIG